MTDMPFYEVLDKALPFIKRGHTVLQKFTCASCGARQTMVEPNIFFIVGTCERCGAKTNIEQRGCGYMMIASR